MGGSMGLLGKGVPPTQMMNMVMGSLYKQFTKKAINNFDDFHVAVLDIFNNFNSALPGRHFDLPTPDEIKARIDLFNSPHTDLQLVSSQAATVDIRRTKLFEKMSALNRTLSSSMSLKLNTPTPFPIFAFPNSKPSEIRFSSTDGATRSEKSNDLSLTLSLSWIIKVAQEEGIKFVVAGWQEKEVGDHRRHTGVWWDLNTCPVPAGVDPRCVRACIESALKKQIGRRSAVSIYAIGNLEYISSDLLQNISSSGIILSHAPCRGNDLNEMLDDWSEDELEKPHPPGYIMMISGDYGMLYPHRFRRYGFTTFVAYPKDVRLVAPLDQLKFVGQEFAQVFAKEFVWETLLSDNLGEKTLSSRDEKPLCICNIRDGVYQACDEFITHLKSEEHRNEFLAIDHYGKPTHFCQVCNYPAYDEYNLILHNQSEEHNRKILCTSATSASKPTNQT
ncbi:hypothetical protein F2Q69_00032723 [Brassica cretica]|uniref:NYN domain-containing protein n=1 Tax=Brassica cretica TaxID=69181 RepID=A0A8S9SF32_BRACR|nr:hypothetical protein F2Q69_00032723 [Brassica cretica]